MEIPPALSRYFRSSSSTNRRKRGPIAAATWDRSAIYFLTAAKRGDTVRVERRGTIALAEGVEPLAALAEYFDAQQVDVRRLVLLMPRADLEMSTFDVPRVSEDDLPSVVQLELDGKVGESDRELIADFFVPGGQMVGSEAVQDAGDPVATAAIGGDADAAGRRVIAYWMFEETRQRWREKATAAGLQLEAITARQVAPLGLIRDREIVSDSLTVAVVVYNGEIEFVFFRGDEILFLRSIRIGTSDVEALAEQVQTEIRRTASMTTMAADSESLDVLLLVCGNEFTEGEYADLELLADRLSARLVGDAHAGRERDSTSLSTTSDRQSAAVNLVLLSAASEFLTGKLAVDLISPKRSPVPPNPVYRWAALGSAVAILVGLSGYFMLADVQELRTTLAIEKTELSNTQQVAAKLQEKADQTRAVRQWLGDQTDWLDQLRLLSERFPEGQDAHLRRLRAVATEGASSFDLSIEVKSPEWVAELENRLRSAGFSVSSQQVSEQAGNSEYPWQFEARLRLLHEPLDDREDSIAFTPPISPSDRAANDSTPPPITEAKP